MNNTGYVLAAVAVMAIVTYLPRMLPLTLVRKRITNRFLQSFLYYVPYAVLAAMTFPEVLFSTSNLISALAGLAAALILAFRGKGLLPVALTACGTVFLCEGECTYLTQHSTPRPSHGGYPADKRDPESRGGKLRVLPAGKSAGQSLRRGVLCRADLYRRGRRDCNRAHAGIYTFCTKQHLPLRLHRQRELRCGRFLPQTAHRYR